MSNELIIDIDPSLKPDLSKHQRRYNNEGLENDLKETHKLGNLILGVDKSDFKHLNYLDYLILCWAGHYAPVITPDYIWYTILCEITQLISKNADKPEIRSLFTTQAEGKKEIIVQSNSSYRMPLDVLVNALKPHIPVGIDNFLPRFTTSNENTKMAFHAAFADAVSPYYNYSMLMCGFPKIVIRGELQDYAKLLGALVVLPDELKRLNQTYFDRLSLTLAKIWVALQEIDNRDFFNSILTMTPCGSGSQYEVSGWFANFFVDKKPKMSRNFSSHVSRVDYKQLDTNKEYSMFVGLFSSHLTQDNILEPQFNQIIFDKAGYVEPIKQDSSFEGMKINTDEINAGRGKLYAFDPAWTIGIGSKINKLEIYPVKEVDENGIVLQPMKMMECSPDIKVTIEEVENFNGLGDQTDRVEG